MYKKKAVTKAIGITKRKGMVLRDDVNILYVFVRNTFPRLFGSIKYTS
jgi:hypothetical protein